MQICIMYYNLTAFRTSGKCLLIQECSTNSMYPLRRTLPTIWQKQCAYSGDYTWLVKCTVPLVIQPTEIQVIHRNMSILRDRKISEYIIYFLTVSLKYVGGLEAKNFIRQIYIYHLFYMEYLWYITEAESNISEPLIDLYFNGVVSVYYF